MQIRRLTPHEKTGVVSAYGNLATCQIGECENPAEYVAVVFVSTYRLCQAHKDELDALLLDKQASETKEVIA